MKDGPKSMTSILKKFVVAVTIEKYNNFSICNFSILEVIR